ncbi:MAG: universal stress protein [Rhodocyclales bacterium GT-UBC]|nr:MAG: universal stress protein [Rhodocyclales bacterium GT-UBC]
MKPSHIVAATDFSASARHAAERAARLAAESAAALSLVHVADLAPLAKIRKLLANDPERFEQQLLEDLRRRMHDLGQSIAARFDVQASVCLACGDLLGELQVLTSEAPADLMVLGARGERYLRHMMLGSTAERLLGSAHCPMLVVKQVAHETYRHVLVAVDFSSGTEAALNLAHQVAPSAELTVLHVFDVPFEGQLRYAGVDEEKIQYYRQQARRQAEEALQDRLALSAVDTGRVRLMVAQGQASERILEQEQNLDCDLIVVGKHGEGKFEELILGSTTKHILAESQCDVLVSIQGTASCSGSHAA